MQSFTVDEYQYIESLGIAFFLIEFYFYHSILFIWEANNWGTCSDGTEAVGCGPQETYRNCADITVGNNHGVRGHNFMQFQVIPNLNLERIVSNEIPKDNFITYHPVQWPKDYNSQEKLSSKNSTIESLRGNNATNHHNESNDEKNI